MTAFQKDHGLPPTGAARPGDETIKALNEQILRNADGIYIWRSVGDDKVRKSHAALNGTTRRFSASPAPGGDE